jgi:hypothetical protein
VIEAEAGRGVVRARESFAVYLDGHPITVVAGDLFYADDRVVQGREALFGPLHVRTSAMPRSAGSRTAAAVETADAAPGTKRATVRRKGGSSDAS